MEIDGKREVQGVVKRILAIFAFIVVIAIGVFGSIAIASAIPGAFSGAASAIGSVFGGGSSNGSGNQDHGAITLSAPERTINNGETFILSWDHTEQESTGSYTFRYECVDGVSFSSPTGNADTTIFCNTPFNVSTAKSVTLKAVSTSAQDTEDVVVYIDYTPSGESVSVVSDSGTISVSNAAGSNTGTGGSGGGGTTVTVPIGPISDPNGVTDLSVRLVAIGVVNKASGVFYPVINPSRSSTIEQVAIQFEVRNDGTKTSPVWTFSAVLPTAQSYTFNSGAQSALAPGQSIVYTLAFDTFISASQGVVTVQVDQNNLVIESNESNNTLSQVITTSP